MRVELITVSSSSDESSKDLCVENSFIFQRISSMLLRYRSDSLSFSFLSLRVMAACSHYRKQNDT